MSIALLSLRDGAPSSLPQCDDGWRTAEDLADAGVSVEAVVDTRANARQRSDAPWRTIAGGTVEKAHGSTALAGVTVSDGTGQQLDIACDLLAMSNGWNPTLHLTCHLGHKPAWNEAAHAFVPTSHPPA